MKLLLLLILAPLTCLSQSSAMLGYSQGFMSEESGSRWGISAGISLSKKTEKHFRYEQCFLYSHKGSGLTGTIYGANGVSNQINCFEMPAYLIYKTGKTSFGIGLGPCIALQTRAKYKVPSEQDYWYIDNKNATGFDTPIYLKVKRDILKDKAYIQVQYAHGLINQFNNSKTRTLTVYIGICIK